MAVPDLIPMWVVTARGFAGALATGFEAGATVAVPSGNFYKDSKAA